MGQIKNGPINVEVAVLLARVVGVGEVVAEQRGIGRKELLGHDHGAGPARLDCVGPA